MLFNLTDFAYPLYIQTQTHTVNETCDHERTSEKKVTTTGSRNLKKRLL